MKLIGAGIARVKATHHTSKVVGCFITEGNKELLKGVFEMLNRKAAEKIFDIIYKNDIFIGKTDKRVSDYIREIEFYSPAGEDFIFDVFYNSTIKDFVKNWKIYAEDFDADHHAEMWVDSRGKRGVPGTIRELVDDAEAIKEFLTDIARQFEEAIECC